MLRIPRRLIDLASAERYFVDECLDVTTIGEHVLVDFLSADEAGADWLDEGESEVWLPQLLPLRTELANGDLRCLYLGWLAVGKDTAVVSHESALDLLDLSDVIPNAARNSHPHSTSAGSRGTWPRRVSPRRVVYDVSNTIHLRFVVLDCRPPIR